MSSAEDPTPSVFDADEDNSPFPNGGLDSIMPSSRREPSPDGKPMDAKDGHQNHEHVATTYLNSSPVEEGSTESDADSLLLYQQDDSQPVQISSDNRVTRLLSSGKKARILIDEAGKSSEGMASSSKKYVVYTIKLVTASPNSEEIQTRRRYSDFESLRDILTRIFPLVVIPPIPPKNYFSLNVLNGLVGSTSGSNASGVNGTSSSSVPSAVTDTEQAPGIPSYSYINSRYLNKSRLIEHRKRLLANFLNNCLSIPQIRKLDFFVKFLDPSSNWSDEIALISSQLPKSVYQSNPENGLSTDPIYASLPIPSSNHSISIPFSSSIKNKLSSKISYFSSSLHSDVSSSTSQSTSTQGQGDEGNNKIASPDVSPERTSRRGSQSSKFSNSQLDEINKMIINNFIGMTNDYVELGTILNSFSMVITESSKSEATNKAAGDDTKTDIVIDKIGIAFDSSYNTINTLISELETKFSEPLGEAVKYTSVFESTKRFKEKKLKQNFLIETELKEKKKELANSLRAELEVSKIEQGLHSQSLNKPPKFNLEANRANSSVEKHSGKGRFLPSISSVKKFTKYVSDIMDQDPENTRKQRIGHLQDRIKVLEKLSTIMSQDISYITDELQNTTAKFHRDELKSMFQILLNYNSIFVSWAKKNLEIWEEIKEEIQNSS